VSAVRRVRRALVPCFTVLLALAALTAGCHRRMVPLPTLVVGPMQDGASIATFERMLEAVRAEGYHPVQIEPRFGSFSVEPHAVTPGVSFEIQCFADGRVQLRVAGVDRSPSLGVSVVPQPIRGEAMVLASALEAHGGGGFH
jgi:hypothetical protein